MPSPRERGPRGGSASAALLRDLRAAVGTDAVGEPTALVGADQTEGRGVRGRADAVVMPATAREAVETVAWCYDHDVAIVPRGGGTGYAGGAVPIEGGVVVALDRMTKVRSLEPALWRGELEAGIRTAEVHRRAREQGLLFPPDPGAAEQSQLGGNIATNAGGPHAFRYGVTGHWVTGLEAVVAPGRIARFGGPTRKDVAGYDIAHLMVGSEGTLGLITAAWLRFVPAPEAVLPVYAFYPDAVAGADAVLAVLASGLRPAALEYLDGRTLEIAGAGFPAPVPDGAGFLLVAEADGPAQGAEAMRDELAEVLGAGALEVGRPADRGEVRALWRWRDGVSLAVAARRGGKVSEDIVVPVERLGEAVEATLEIGARHGLEACSWGHAGDGNLHSTVLVDPAVEGELERARAASLELLQLAVDLGGSVSGEHGLGSVRSGQLERQWPAAALDAHEAVKRALDPKGLFNPGKKLARPPPPGRRIG